jgi:hypothetical protein
MPFHASENDYVFISYSRRDQTFVDMLSNDLRESGVKVWRDVDSIIPGTNWQLEINKAIKQAQVYLYVSSENSAKSQWMFQERMVGAKRGKAIIEIPVVIDDAGEQLLPQELKRIQWVDFRQGYKTAFQKLLAVLAQIGLAHPEHPLKPKEQQTKGYVFLSYAEEDSKFVDRLKIFLGKHGYAYWDYRESDRDYHKQLYLELEGVIREASATLSILSPDWKQSGLAMKEYFFSGQVSVPVFLLRAREVEPTLAIADELYIDFVNNHRRGLKLLEKELRRKGL